MHPDVSERLNRTIIYGAESIREHFSNTNFSQYSDSEAPDYGEEYNMTEHSDLGMDIFTDRDFLPPDLPLNIKVFFILTYSIIMVLSVIGNSLVIWVIAANTKMRTVTNTYLVSLAASDMLIAVVNMPFQLLFIVENEWTLGSVTCKMSSYVQGVTIIVSILTLSGMAVER